MKRRSIAALVLALTMLGAGVAPTLAVTPNPKSIIDHYVVKHKVGNKNYVKMRDGNLMLQTETRRCYYAYWIAEARNIVDVVLFQYKEQVEWCSSRGRDGRLRIVYSTRWTMPITPRPWLWQYASETLYGADYNLSRSRVTYSARGLFNQVILTLFGTIIVGQSHPLVTIKARANGTAEGWISWG